MNIYVDQLYFDVLEQLRTTLPKDNLSNNKAQNLKSIYNLFLALNIHTDITRDEVIENYKKGIGDKDYKTIKELILFAAVKSNIVTDVDLATIKDYNGFYFTQHNITSLNASGCGIVMKNESFDCTNFYENCKIADLKFKGDINELKEFVPPTNAMIIVDNYLFEDANKIQNLIDFLNLYKGQLNDIKFQVSIFSYSDRTATVTSAFDQLCIIDENIQIQITLVTARPQGNDRDRQIYTNYATLNFGHPFENKETHFSQNFLGLENDKNRIKINYSNFKSHLKNCKDKITSTPQYFGPLQTQKKWESEKFTNRLFEMIN